MIKGSSHRCYRFFSGTAIFASIDRAQASDARLGPELLARASTNEAHSAFRDERHLHRASHCY
jgi:hypothetical protein